MRGPPRGAGLRLILLVRKERAQTQQGGGQHRPEQRRGAHPSIQRRAGHHHRQQPAEGVDPQRALAPWPFFPIVIPALRATPRGGLARRASDARGTWGGCVARFAAPPFAPRVHALGPGPIITPWRTRGIHRALGQQSMRQPLPLTATPMEGKHCVQDCPHGYGAWTPCALVRLGRREPRCHEGPWRVCEIRCGQLSVLRLCKPRSALRFERRGAKYLSNRRFAPG